MFSKLNNFINSKNDSSGMGKDEFYLIKDTDKNIPFIEIPSDNEFFQFGMLYGKAIADRVLRECPDFPEGIKKKHDSDKTPKEMFILYCHHSFYEPSRNILKDEMNDLYQNHENIPYPQVCAEVDKGLIKSISQVWDLEQDFKHQKLGWERERLLLEEEESARRLTLDELRPIPEVQVNYPF